MTMKLFALLAALAVYCLWQCRRAVWGMIRNPSPTERPGWGSWVKALLGKGSRSDPDPDEEEAGERPRYRLHDDEHVPARTRVEWLDRPRPELDDDRRSRDDEIVEHFAELQRRGWKYSERMDDTMREFRCSESTVKRALRRAREAEER